MSRTIRAYKYWVAWGDSAKVLECGHVSIPKSNEMGDEVWGQKCKKAIKKEKARKVRRERGKFYEI